ncbi:glycosyltransferase [Butyricimonas hominis]|uniref:glycosyltransferase n=1 Tax=Butyricimonas hominis TaxID=2763032 RepID=UPI003513B330
MKSILFLINNLGSGGAQRQIVELAVRFKQSGYNVRFLIYERAFSDFYFETLANHGIEIDDVAESNYLKRIYKVRRYIRTSVPDVLIAFLEASSFMAELASFPSKKWRLIVGERSANPAIKKSLKLKFFRQFHVLADYIVANSYENIRIIQEIAPIIKRDKYKVIYNIFNEDKLKPIDDFEFGKHDKLNLVVTSSHRYLKNLDGLIEGVKLMNSEDRNKLRINWYGSNLFDDSLEKALEKVKNYDFENIFSFHKDTLNIYEFMKEADAIGLFSYFEGLPNAICEGMLLGKPIIATRVSDIPLFIKDRVNGFLCDAADPMTIAQALSSLVSSSSEELSIMGKCNYEVAQKLFDREQILKAYESLF